MRYGEIMSPLDLSEIRLPDDMSRDPEVAIFIEIVDRVSRAEVVSHYESWTEEERRIYDGGDWKTFSRLRGYSEVEIDDFALMLEHAHRLTQKYSQDDVEVVFYEHQLQTGILGLDPKDILSKRKTNLRP